VGASTVSHVVVSHQPVVALIPTGDELVLAGEAPGAAQIVTSNNFGLSAMLRAVGAAPRLCPIARDDPDSLREALAAAEGADVIVTLGGASVGDHDLVADVFGDMGLALEFHKVAMRPGKPLMSGRIGDTVMIGLPGNPVSAMVCGEIFVRPALDAAMGLQAGLRATRPAPLAHDLGPNGSREHYMRAMMDDEGRVRVFDNQDSSLIHVRAAADALVVRPPHAPALPAGAAVRTVLL